MALSCSPQVGQVHLILRESSGLVRADDVCAAHSFAGVELSDEVLIVEHLLDRVGQR